MKNKISFTLFIIVFSAVILRLIAHNLEVVESIEVSDKKPLEAPKMDYKKENERLNKENAEYRELIQEMKEAEKIKAEKVKIAKAEKKKREGEKRDFANKYKEYALQNEKFFNIPFEITLGQAILESNAGNSTLAQNGNNFFGIKCGQKVCTHQIKCISKLSPEQIAPGVQKHKLSKFRRYETEEKGFIAHAKFLQKDRYKRIKGNYKQWAKGLKKQGYATDENYPQKLINVIEKYIN